MSTKYQNTNYYITKIQTVYKLLQKELPTYQQE